MDGGLRHCTGGSDQGHPQEEERRKGKLAVWGGLTNSWKRRSERQRTKGKDIPIWMKISKEYKGETRKPS